MALWSGLLVLILSFYVTASQLNQRHDRISDSYRKVHGLMETLDGLLSRSQLHSLHCGVNLAFSRLESEQPITPFGQLLWQEPEILVLEPSERDTLSRDQCYPMYGQIALSSRRAGKRVLWKLDLGWRVDVHPYKAPPPPAPQEPGTQHILVVDVRIPADPTAQPKTPSENDMLSRVQFERYILLENCIATGLPGTLPRYVP